MKKLVISVLMMSSFLVSCANNNTFQMPVEPINNPNQISTFSDKGLVNLNRELGKKYFEVLDFDKNAVISLDEYKNIKLEDYQRRFRSVDRNKDGSITMEEMMNNRKNFMPDVHSKTALREMAKYSFSALDENKDAILPKQEFVKMFQSKTPDGFRDLSPEMANLANTMFNIVDINNDNVLDFPEFEDFIFASIKDNLLSYIQQDSL